MAIQENRLDEPKSEGIPRLWLTLNECGVQLGRVSRLAVAIHCTIGTKMGNGGICYGGQHSHCAVHGLAGCRLPACVQQQSIVTHCDEDGRCWDGRAAHCSLHRAHLQ